MAQLSEWDSFNRHIQSGLSDGQFMSSQYTLLAAGPPTLAFLTSALTVSGEGSNEGSAIVFPLGITQRFGLAHTRQHARVWEIGSERCYWITGRTVGQISLGRILYHGPSLLRALFAYYAASVEGDPMPPLIHGPFVDLANQNRNPRNEIRISPGYENMFLNLASDLFNQTIGLLMYFRDSNDESVFAGYAESCVLPNHSLGFDAGGVVIQENAQIQFERLVPVKLSGVVPLIDIDKSGVVSTAAGTFAAETGQNF
jgi:hypothetical protein